jgi:hypothetical protein
VSSGGSPIVGRGSVLGAASVAWVAVAIMMWIMRRRARA